MPAVGACACGGGCPTCASAVAFQPELEVSQPNDPLELEADLVAEQVLSGDAVAARSRLGTAPRTTLQRACTCGSSKEECTCEEGEFVELQRKSMASETPRSPPDLQEVLSGPGQPLPAGLRSELEPRFGRDFTLVLLHTDARALAYTVGREVVFAPRQYAPQTPSGRRLIAHELTHVAQQGLRGSPLSLMRQTRPSTPPVSFREARATGGETGMGFAGYRSEEGWAFLTGPGGSAEHRWNEPGFDGVAFKSQGTVRDPHPRQQVASATWQCQQSPKFLANVLKSLGRMSV